MNLQNTGTFSQKYRRYNPITIVCLFGFGMLTLLSAISLIVCGIVVARPVYWAMEFKNTTCVVVKIENRGDVQCSCGSSGDSNSKSNCYSSYPCIAVLVEYNVTKEEKNVTMMSIAHESEIIGIDDSECSTVPSCSSSFYSNNQSVYDFVDEKGQMNNNYYCYYNPDNFENVIFEKIFTEYHAQLALGLSAAGFIVGVIGSLYSLIAMMTKSKHEVQTYPVGGTMGSGVSSYPTQSGFGSYPQPPPPALSPVMESYGVATGMQPIPMVVQPPPAYNTQGVYGGFTPGYPPPR